MTDVAYIECMAAQEAVYWEARRQNMGLDDKNVGDLLRIAAPHLLDAERVAFNDLLVEERDRHTAEVNKLRPKADMLDTMAQVANKLEAVVKAARDLIEDGHRTPIPLAPHQGVLWANLERALVSL